MGTKIKNIDSKYKTFIVLTREEIGLDPGEEVEIEGDIEIG
jgi:hypothetical protein